MVGEAQILIATALSIALLHTLVGPDHYLPFAALGRARGWSLAKTLKVTLFCGLGHVLASVLLGLVGIAVGAQVAGLVALQDWRGEWAGWALIAFGLLYACWGLRQARKPHHHRHGEVIHSHPHEPSHLHEAAPQHAASLTPWALFVIFALGPCEALIPLLLYPAAQQSYGLVMIVALCFGVTTLLTMLGAVAATLVGLQRLRWSGWQRYAHALAGASIVLCGSAISLLGV